MNNDNLYETKKSHRSCFGNFLEVPNKNDVIQIEYCNDL